MKAVKNYLHFLYVSNFLPYSNCIGIVILMNNLQACIQLIFFCCKMAPPKRCFSKLFWLQPRHNRAEKTSTCRSCFKIRPLKSSQPRLFFENFCIRYVKIGCKMICKIFRNFLFLRKNWLFYGKNRFYAKIKKFEKFYILFCIRCSSIVCKIFQKMTLAWNFKSVLI